MYLKRQRYRVHAFQRLIILAIASTSLLGCMHLDSVAVDNQTADPLSVRVSVDRWFNAYECSTGDALGSLDRDATFTIDPGEMLCLRGEASRESYDAREHVRSLALVRQGQRCFYGTHEQLRESFGQKVRGFRVFEVDDAVCSPAGSRAGAAGAAGSR